jgi:hypothetical protein
MEMNLSIDWRKMEMPRARRKTPLKNAPSSDARAKPKENSCGDLALSDA